MGGYVAGLVGFHASGAHILRMVTFRADTCDKRKNASPISYRVKPEAAWKMVVLNRWRKLCPGCFDVEAEKARVPYRFVASWSWSA